MNVESRNQYFGHGHYQGKDDDKDQDTEEDLAYVSDIEIRPPRDCDPKCVREDYAASIHSNLLTTEDTEITEEEP